ncbi:MAG: STAS domain-containing protein [Candidatus Eremiobacteraeota bacterium]|nr:STAS domain-containing protein [Candidatus Eremiobacteraeota bacterium]
MQMTDAARALCVLDRNAPYGFHIWLAGAWGFETQERLREVLRATPRVSRKIDLDCRRVTIIDGATMKAMTNFADDCATRGVGVTFSCDTDPVGRLIDLCGLDRLTVMHRPLHPRTAGWVWAERPRPLLR